MKSILDARAPILLLLGVAVGCSDAGTSTPSDSTGGAGAGGHGSGSGGAPSPGGAGNGGRVGEAGGTAVAGQSARGGTAGSGGDSGSAGNTPSGGAFSGGAGNASSGGAPPGAGAGGRDAGTSGMSGRPQGGTGGGAAAAGAAGSSSGGRGGMAGAGGIAAGGTGGGGGTIDTKNVTTSCPGAVPAGITSSWCSCEQWGEKLVGNNTYYNNLWGSGPGPQCIWLTDSGMWGVASNHPKTDGIKSYPNVSLSPKKAISSINTYTSSFDIVVPSAGAYDTAYDLWVKGTTSARIEIMLWVSYRETQPIAKSYDAAGAIADVKNVSVGGHTWNVYYGTNGANDVASFLRTSNTTAGSIDIKAILQWLIDNNHSSYGVFNATYTLDQVQFGTEITSDSGIQAYVTRSFSVTSN
jgi:hypothetical protein